MQDRSHRQSPLLTLIPLEGEGRSVEELELACTDDLREVVERHLAALAGSSSRWLPFLALLAEECGAAVTGVSIRAL